LTGSTLHNDMKSVRYEVCRNLMWRVDFDGLGFSRLLSKQMGGNASKMLCRRLSIIHSYH
jgi:hypothetical protein